MLHYLKIDISKCGYICNRIDRIEMQINNEKAKDMKS